MAERGRGSRRVVGRHLLLPWAAPSRGGGRSVVFCVEPHECVDPSRGACAGVMSRRWLSTCGVSGLCAKGRRER